MNDQVDVNIQLPTNIKPHFHFDQPIVEIGRSEDLSGEQHARLLAVLESFRPWKKGPFNIFGNVIDSEWRCDMKWERLAANLPRLKGARIADIGCNNAYYMFRMAAYEPAEVVGIEPVLRHAQYFEMLQTYLKQTNLRMDVSGVETIDEKFPKYFDVVFCLGILYHYTDPIGVLRKIFKSMQTAGTLIIDCMGIPGDEPVALTPRKRYTGCGGMWSLPTQSCLENWISRAGFRNIETFYAGKLTTEEQRPTSWADNASLENGLDPNDSSKTIEGYPAPMRFYVRAQR